MDEREKKRRRLNTEGESVNWDHDKETDNRPTEELHIPDSLKASDVADLTTEDFKVVRTKLTFVDKSEGIKRLFECPASGVQITAPRGFGKSTFMNMLQVFLIIEVDKDGRPISNPESSDNYKMFMELKLGQKHGGFVKQHCGQYPVISLNLQRVGGETRTDILDSLKDAICKTYEQHFYLVETAPDGSQSFKTKKIRGIQTFLKYGDRDELQHLSETNVIIALEFLSKILYDHFKKKVVILVDDADAPIMKAITDTVDNETLKYLMRLLRDMLSAGLKGNEFLERSLVSSCVRLSGVYSWEINNQDHAVFLQTKHFSETYGFTEQEVHNLLENAALQAVNDFNGVKKWYNGYQMLHQDGVTIYNSWSVVKYLSKSIEEGKKMFDTCWSNSGLLDILEELLVHQEIHERINKLINGENISIVVAEPTVKNILELKNTISFPSTKLNEKQVDFFLQLLWDKGLLNAVEKNGNTAVLKIPNLEIKTEIQRKCYNQSLFETKDELKPQLPPERVCEKASWWNRDHDKEKTDGVVATDNRPPEELHIPDSLKASDVADLTTEDFKVVRTKLTFVDKSEGIKRLFECPASGVQITAPRGFGKSTFMNMLQVFLIIEVDKDGRPISNPESSDNYKMFMELKLGQKHGGFVKQHCGQYPVISLNLKRVGGETRTDILDSLKDAICKTFKKHFYLLETSPDGSKSFKNKKLKDIELFLKYYESNRLEELSEANVKKALEFLSKILYDHFNKKVVILVDEADAPIMKAITDTVDNETLKYLMRLLRDMLSAGLKGNQFLQRSLVSSCVRLSYSWEINNQDHVLFLQTKDFSETYGFTEQEVHNLLENAALQAVNDFNGVKKWYNGYQMLHQGGVTIYSSWSVVKYLSKSIEEGKKMFDTYWAKSGLLTFLQQLLVHNEIYKIINKLINGENISIVVAEPDVENILGLKNTISFPSTKLNEKQVDFFLQLLWDEGLLNAVEKYGDTVVLKIPNFEIKTEIQRKCYTQSLFETKYKLKRENIETYIEALNRLLLIRSNEQENEDEESNEEKGEIEESEEGTTEKYEEAIRNLVSAVSLLFSGDAVIPFNESELHHILFFLTYNNKLFTTQSSRAVVNVSEELRDTDELKKFYPREAKTGSQSKRKEKRGRKNECDICVTRGTGGLILELKFLNEDKAKENSRAALEQIIDKKYYKIFDKDEYKYVGTKIYVGLCLKKNLYVAANYLVDNIDINKAKIVHGNK